MHLTPVHLLEFHLGGSLMRPSLTSCNIVIGEGKGNLRIGKVAFSLCYSDRIYGSSYSQQ